jgi:two-component system sensor kinase FixL
MPEPDGSQHEGYLQRYLSTREPRVIGIGREVEGVRRDGVKFPIALSIGESNSDRGRHFVGIIRDLTAQREQEQRARSLESRLAHAGRVNLMGEMAAGIAHEINQPLSAIATYAQAAKRLLQRNPIDAGKLAEVCHKIDEQALRAGQVIEDLRRFLRKQEVDARALDINALIEDVRLLTEADSRAQAIPIRFEYGSGLPRVRADAGGLQQVVLNLTRNAVDAMANLPSKDRGINVRTRIGSAGRVEVAVSDHGHGVSAELGATIFHPFVSTKKDGLGVGLAVSQSIVQSCGGALSYRNNPDGGATFVVSLPPINEVELIQ